MGGKSDETYKGVAAFFHYLSQTDVQEYLHQTSGYLPVTMAAYKATKEAGSTTKNPGRETPITQMMGKAPTENSKGVRLPNLPQVRDIENEEFEKMLAGEQTAQQALDNAVERGNAAIKEAIGSVTCDTAAPVQRGVRPGFPDESRNISPPLPAVAAGCCRSCLITLVFFYWPALQAMWQSMLREDPFGLSSTVRRASTISARC